MYFKVLTWENIGWEESSASSINKLTRSLEERLEKQELRHWLLDQLASLDLWFMDKLLNIMPSWSTEEVSHSLKSERLVLPHNSPNQLESLLITEDITRMLNIKLPTSPESTNTNPSSFFSQDTLVSPRRELSTIHLPTNWRQPVNKTPLTVSSQFQLSPQESSQLPSPRLASHSEPTTPRDSLELTRDTQVSEPREQRKPRLPRSELDVGRCTRARLYLQLIQFGSLKSTKLYYAYILYGQKPRKCMLTHYIFIFELLYDTRQITEKYDNEYAPFIKYFEYLILFFFFIY